MLKSESGVIYSTVMRYINEDDRGKNQGKGILKYGGSNGVWNVAGLGNT